MNAFKKYLLYKKLMNVLDSACIYIDEFNENPGKNEGFIKWQGTGYWSGANRYRVVSRKENYHYSTFVKIKNKEGIFFGNRRSKKLYRAAYQVAMVQQQREELAAIREELRALRKKSR